MKKEDIELLIDNGHGFEQAYKCSPDKRLVEYKFAREIAASLEERLLTAGYHVRRIVTEESAVPIRERVRRANRVCSQTTPQRCLLISIHSNAIGDDNRWHTSRGWSVFVSKKASHNSKRMAELLYQEAMAAGLRGNRATPAPDAQGRHFWTWSWRKDDITLLTDTACPAVMTENLFHDTREDVAFMLTEAGKQTIVDLHLRAIERYIAEM